MDLRIDEVNETGELTTTYVQTSSNGNQRIDVISPERTANLWSQLLGVFLPAGYPHSVTKDYINYQIYDSLQAFSSSIAGLLSSRAVLQGVGVGDASASPTAALLLSVLQESMGRVATILFAHKLGTSLEPECKMYRLAADVFNDAAMVLDCLSPALPKAMRVLLLSFSGVLRALCGVAAGSSKASLSAHFAKWGNLGELNAKDSSQETIISLLGMVAGSIVVSWVSSPIATWSWLILLLSLHLAMNHAAVRAVSMHTVNRQRANILFSTFLDHDKVLDPEQISGEERIFEWDGVLRWKGSTPFAKARIGVCLQTLLSSMVPPHTATSSIVSDTDWRLAKLFKIFDQEQYLLWYDFRRQVAYIVLKTEATPVHSLKAWAHALIVAHQLEADDRYATGARDEQVLEYLEATLISLLQSWKSLVERLVTAGWDVNTANLETTSGTRIRFTQIATASST